GPLAERRLGLKRRRSSGSMSCDGTATLAFAYVQSTTLRTAARIPARLQLTNAAGSSVAFGVDCGCRFSRPPVQPVRRSSGATLRRSTSNMLATAETHGDA